MKYEVMINGQPYDLELTRSAEAPAHWRCKLDGMEVELDAVLAERGVLSILLNGRSYEVKRDLNAAGQTVILNGTSFICEVRDPRALRGRRAAGNATQGPKKITAPMPGKVVRVIAPAGTAVEAGEGVIVIEAMKMQNELKSPKKGTVQKIVANEGAAVNAGETLAIIE